jgi:hypothetical protein
MSNILASDAPISREEAYAICAQLRQEHEGKWYTFDGLMCWGCQKFSGGDPARMCVSNAPDYRGCIQVNRRYDALLNRTQAEMGDEF